MSKRLTLIFLFLSFYFCTQAYEDYKVVYENGKAGIKFIDTDKRIDKWVLPAEYDSVVIALRYQPVTLRSVNLFEGKGYFLTYRSGKKGLFAVGGDDYNKVILNCTYEKVIFNIDNGRVILMENSKWGVYLVNKVLSEKDKDGEWILPVEWEVFDLFSENRLCIVGNKGKVGVYDIGNKSWVLDVEYDKISYSTKPDYDEILLPSKNGKMGALSIKYDYEPVSKWIIPLNQYDKISHTVPRSNFLIVDSAGKFGLWQFTETKRYVDPVQKAWALTAAEYIRISYKGEVASLEKEGFTGSISKGGWITRSDQKELNTKMYSICNTTVLVNYVPDSGYQISCLASAKSRSIMIRDTVRYDSVALKGNIFYGYKARKITAYLIHYSIDRRTDIMYLSKEFPADGLIPKSSQLLVSGAQQCYPFPKSVKDDELVIDRAITYLKDGKWVWRRIAAITANSTGVETYPFTPADPVDKWDTVLMKYSTHEKMPFLLVSNGGKWGILGANGREYVTKEHDAYKVLDAQFILFRKADTKKWRIFDAEYASALDGYNRPADGGLMVFSHLGKPTIDFSSLSFENGEQLVNIGGKEYFLVSKYDGPSTVVYYTSEKKSKLNHTVIHKFVESGVSYTIEKTPTGVGVYKGNREVIPPYLPAIQRENNVLVVTDKNTKDRVKISHGLNMRFSADNFITITDTMTCTSCGGAGGRTMDVTRIEAGSTQYSTKKIIDYKEGSKSVWDTRTNSYVNVKTTTPVTRYETSSTKSADKTVTEKAFDMCRLCKGVGHFNDVRRDGKVNSLGLQLSEYNPNKKGTTTTVSYPAK